MKIYKITLLNWFEHNPKAKKSFKKTMIEHRLISDATINSMPLSHRWLFINLILICGDHANDTITLTQRQINDILTTKEGAENALTLMSQFQLLSFEKTESFRIEVKEKNRKEEKLKETNRSAASNPEKIIEKEPASHLSKAQDRGRIDDFDFCLDSLEMLKNVTHSLQRSWLTAYPNAEWIMHEMLKANAWQLANPKKKSKDFGRFFNNWLARSFENYRKNLPSQKSTYADRIQQHNEQVKKQMFGDET